MVVMDGACVYPFNEEPDEDIKNGWTFGMIDVEQTRMMCQSCPFRKWNLGISPLARGVKSWKSRGSDLTKTTLYKFTQKTWSGTSTYDK